MKEINQYLTGKALTGVKLKNVKAVVIHWFADPMAKAANVIKWWQGQANGIAAHDVIDLNGDLYHAVPYDMMSYQVGCPRGYTKEALKRLSSYPNNCVVGIECAHLDWKGTMTPETYDTLVKHSAKLLKKFGLGIDDLWLHSEIVGKDYKDCHRWFTTTKPSDWIKFKQDVADILNPSKPADKPKQEQPTQSTSDTYIVQKNDTLWGIATANKMSVDDLKKLNNLKSDVINVGDKLIVKKDVLVNQSVKPTDKPKAVAKKQYLQLPASATSWNVYPLNKAAIKANAIGALNPQKFGGLEYQVLGNPQADVYTIQTSNFGKVNIYAAKSTGAKIILK